MEKLIPITMVNEIDRGKPHTTDFFVMPDLIY